MRKQKFHIISKKIIFIMLFSTITTYAVAQTLWQNTEYGMSVEEIQKLFPSSFIPDPPDKYFDVIEQLRLNDYIVVNENFYVSFLFKDNELRHVILTCQNLPNKTRGQLIFNNLEQSLTAQYGTPFSTKKADSMLGASMWDCNWLLGRTDIGLHYISIRDDTINLSVVYKIQIMEEADE